MDTAVPAAGNFVGCSTWRLVFLQTDNVMSSIRIVRLRVRCSMFRPMRIEVRNGSFEVGSALLEERSMVHRCLVDRKVRWRGCLVRRGCGLSRAHYLESYQSHSAVCFHAYGGSLCYYTLGRLSGHGIQSSSRLQVVLVLKSWKNIGRSRHSHQTKESQ
jgi:hypothetical protein